MEGTVVTNEVKELLAGDGNSSATVEQYVEAARLLTRLRRYRSHLAEQVELLSEPGFGPQWSDNGFARNTGNLFDLEAIDERAAKLDGLLSMVDNALADPLWVNVEATVRRAAVPLRRTAHRSDTLCVLDARGEWITKGTGQLVKGTRGELEAAEQRWSALSDVLPPSHPAESAMQLGPGVA